MLVPIVINTHGPYSMMIMIVNSGDYPLRNMIHVICFFFLTCSWLITLVGYWWYWQNEGYTHIHIYPLDHVSIYTKITVNRVRNKIKQTTKWVKWWLYNTFIFSSICVYDRAMMWHGMINLYERWGGCTSMSAPPPTASNRMPAPPHNCIQ